MSKKTRREEYLERIQTVDIDRKIRIVKVLEGRGMLSEVYRGVSNSIDSICKVLEEVYPSEWDIIIKKRFYNGLWQEERPFTIEFVIHFPSIIITNKDNLSHEIKDMYIKLMPSQSYDRTFTFNNFRGKRMTASKNEIISNYQHSHQPGRAWSHSTDGAFIWRDFCLGSSEIKQVLSMLESRYDEGRFKLLLLQLDEYLNYESIEGNPYCYLRNVLGGGAVPSLANKTIKEYYTELIELRELGSIPEVRLDFKIENNQVIIKDNDKLEDFLKTDSNKDNYNVNYICEKDEKGNYHRYRNIPTEFPSDLIIQPEDYPKIEFYFRAEKVSFKLVDGVYIQDKPFYINKFIKDYVKTKLEQQIEERRYRHYITEKLNSPSYATEDTRPNTVLVSKNK